MKACFGTDFAIETRCKVIRTERSVVANAAPGSRLNLYAPTPGGVCGKRPVVLRTGKRIHKVDLPDAAVGGHNHKIHFI